MADDPESQTSEPVDLASSTPLSLARAVHARRADFVRPHRTRIKVGTWNVAGRPGTDKDLAAWFVSGKGLDPDLGGPPDLARNPAIEREDSSGQPLREDPSDVRLVGGDKIGLYVLGLQEIVDLNLAREYMNRLYPESGDPAKKWITALEEAMPEGYKQILVEHMAGLVLLVYASPEVAASIGSVSAVQVGTGLMGYLGNKGAVSGRVVLGETTRLVFVNCHLASGQEQAHLERRVWDAEQVVARTSFSPVERGGVLEDESEKIGDEDFAFWFGDLNFRLDGLPGDDIRRLLTLHTRGEYDVSKTDRPPEGEGVIVPPAARPRDDDTDSSSDDSLKKDFNSAYISLPDPDDFLPDANDDPASLQATLNSLLSHDQLHRMMKQGKVFHDGWREGPITFLPSYKYDAGTVSLFDSSEKRRAPSWCDRILFRTRRDREDHERKREEAEKAKKRDEELRARGVDHAADDDDVLFDYDPDADGEAPGGRAGVDYDEYDDAAAAENGDGTEVVTKDGSLDRIKLEIYTSHQRITSSDHKPIIAVFSLDYDAVVPELKAKVHAEVARELDRAENEGRPVVTLAFEGRDSMEIGGLGTQNEQSVDFGAVGFLARHSASITVANTGRVTASFSFVSKPSAGTGDDSSEESLRWLTTRFMRSELTDEGGKGDVDDAQEVTLEPGETTVALVELRVASLALARALNHGTKKLDDVLVLRVSEGRDHFIPVRAAWQPSCFGRSIDELIRVPEGGIRSLALPRLEKGQGVLSDDLPVHCSAPRELFKLTEALESLVERALADEQMLDERRVPREAPGWPFDEDAWSFKDVGAREEMQVALIRALDMDKALSEALPVEQPALHRAEVVAKTLLLFLEGLSDGIITPELWTRIQAALPNLGGPFPGDSFEDDKVGVLDVLSASPHRNIAFVFLTTTLAKLAAELAPVTKADIEAVAAARKPAILGRRSLSFRRSGGGDAVAEAAVARRRARERRFAEVFGPVVTGRDASREGGGGGNLTGKERRVEEERRRGVVELFVHREMD